VEENSFELHVQEREIHVDKKKGGWHFSPAC
jgi:hypothetical protein